MKSNRIILTGLLLFALVFSGNSISAQEKTQEEKEKEAKLQQSIELQKKAMAEEKKQMELQMKEQEKALQELQHNSQELNNYYRIGRTRSSGSNWDGGDMPFVVTTPDGDIAVRSFYGRGGDAERTSWDFSKSVKESTFSKMYTFDVEKSAQNVMMSVNGDCRAGEIRVKIVMPGGKTYSDIVLDEFGNLNWRKSFTISETENQDKTGQWVFKIDATKASGFFKISLQTY